MSNYVKAVQLLLNFCLKYLCLHTGIEVQLLSEADVNRGISVSFPVNEDNIPVQSEVPSSTISKQSFLNYVAMWLAQQILFIAEKYPGPVASTFLANSFLPSDFDGYIEFILHTILTFCICRSGEYNLSFPVLVIQISTLEHVELPENGTVSLTFNTPEVCSFK